MTYVSIKVKTERKNNGIKAENLEKYLNSLANNVLSVGVHKEAGAELVKRAKHTEFGTLYPNNGQWYDKDYGWSGIVPPRPIIRMYLYPEILREIDIEYQLAINNEKHKGLKAPVNNAEDTQKRLGELCVVMQRNKASERGYDESTNTTGYDPNHNGIKTIKYKGFDMTWFQTGQTVSAIDYKIKRKGT